MRDKYLSLAFQASKKRRQRFKTFDDAMHCQWAWDLAEQTGLPAHLAVWLAGITEESWWTHRWLIASQPALKHPSLIFVWAKLAPSKRNAVDINQSRFERWVASARQCDAEFYTLTREALQICRGMPFDLGSLYHIAEALAKRDDAYPATDPFIECVTEFYTNQSKSGEETNRYLKHARGRQPA